MSSPAEFSLTIASIARNSPAVVKQQFKSLWSDHLKLRKDGKMIYFLPRKMGTEMGAYAQQDMAIRLSQLVKDNVYVHFDADKSAFRIGQVLDDNDKRAVNDCIFVFRADFPPVEPAEVLRAAEIAEELNFIASSTHLPSSSQKAEKVPKPRNMWIIYRQDKHEGVLALNPGMHTSQISRVISDMWRNEPASVKSHYQKLAKEEKAKHMLKYPGYKCSPRKSSEIKKRKKTKKTKIHISGAPAHEYVQLATSQLATSQPATSQPATSQPTFDCQPYQDTSEQYAAAQAAHMAFFPSVPDTDTSDAEFQAFVDEVGEGYQAGYYDTELWSGDGAASYPPDFNYDLIQYDDL